MKNKNQPHFLINHHTGNKRLGPRRNIGILIVEINDVLGIKLKRIDPWHSLPLVYI